MNEVWVAFSGECDFAPLKILKAGFRHCFVLMRCPSGWVVIDPLLHKTDVSLIAVDDLPRALRLQGCIVVRAPNMGEPSRKCLVSPFTCVEAVKRIIGLRGFWVMTPFALYRRLSVLSRNSF